MGKMVKIWVGLAALVFMLAGCAGMPAKPESLPQGDYSYLKEYISWLARKEMKKNDVTGLSIALVDDQRVVWAAGFGFADQANQLPARPETIYRVGSISKLFTATAAMQLAEQGTFDIDQPLQAYLPEFSIKRRFAEAAPITPRTIMTHHSGLPSDLLKGMWTKQPEPFQNEVKLLRDEYAATPPNVVFSYSNVGVTLLGHALEKASGRDYAALMEAALLRPLGMDHSAFSQAPDRSPLGSKAYRKGQETEEFPLRGIPAGGLNSSVLDLSRFMRMVLAGGKAGERQLIKPETLAEMLRPQNAGLPLDLDFRIGLAWMLAGPGVDIRNAGPVAHHSGATLYHRSQLVVLPEQKLGVVVLSNSATAGNLVNKLASETLKLALQAKSGIKQPEPKQASTEKGSLSPEQLQAYQGRYATLAGVVDITRTSDSLRANVLGTDLRLLPRPDGLLRFQYKLLGVIPINLGELGRIGISRATLAGHEIVKATINGEELLVGERIRPVPIPEAWHGFAGEYEIVNAGDDALLVEQVQARLDNGLLLVEYGMPHFTDKRMSFAVLPISDSEALISGLGRGMGETLRIVTLGGQEMFRYSGYLFKKKQSSP